MSPILKPNTFAFFKRQSAYKKSDVVLVDHPKYGRIVKSVVASNSAGLWLEGANVQSLSQEALGLVKREYVKGKLSYQIQPKRIAT